MNFVSLLRPNGVISLAEPVPRHTQRLYALVDLGISGRMRWPSKVRAAEEAIYADPGDPLVNWAEDDLRAAFAAAGLSDVAVEGHGVGRPRRASAPAMLGRLVRRPQPIGERPSYGQRLAARLSADELAAVRGALSTATLTGTTVPWRSVTAFVVARARP